MQFSVHPRSFWKYLDFGRMSKYPERTRGYANSRKKKRKMNLFWCRILKCPAPLWLSFYNEPDVINWWKVWPTDRIIHQTQKEIIWCHWSQKRMHPQRSSEENTWYVNLPICSLKRCTKFQLMGFSLHSNLHSILALKWGGEAFTTSFFLSLRKCMKLILPYFEWYVMNMSEDSFFFKNNCFVTGFW